MQYKEIGLHEALFDDDKLDEYIDMICNELLRRKEEFMLIKQVIPA